MRQVGDRLIPIGVTSGRIHPLGEMPIGEHGEGNGEAAGGEGQQSRRSRRRRHQQGQNQDINQLLGTMGLGGQDLEEVRHRFHIFLAKLVSDGLFLVNGHGGNASLSVGA